jgi:hypothetical protein
MDDPIKILIPRSAVEYICRKEKVSTNPDDFTHSEMFIRYLDHDAISSFGRWQWANGYNTALVTVKCGLDKIPTIEPERKHGIWETGTDLEREWYICSKCLHQQWDKTNFCSNCGADMREDEA